MQFLTITPQLEADMKLLNAKLKSLETKEARNAARAGVRAGARVIMREAKARAPVGKSYTRSIKGTRYEHAGGTLKKKGFTLGRGKFGDRNTVSWLVKLARRVKLGIPMDEKGYYPAIVEFGVKRGPRQFKGREFLAGAFRAKGREAAQVAIDASWKYIQTKLGGA